MNRRILHLIPTLENGGAERQVGYLAAGQVALGWDVHVAFTRGGPNLARVEASGATLHSMPAGSSYDPRLVSSATRVIRAVAPAVVQTWLPMMDVIGGLAAVLARTPWILSERTDSETEAHRAKFRLRRQIARTAAAVVSNSEVGNAYWTRRIAPDRCHVLPNALPVGEIDAAPTAARSTYGIPDDAPLVLYVGRLSREKNVDNMLAALERVVAETDAWALLCGAGSFHESVERRIAEGPMRGRVLAPGFVGDTWSWLKTADLCVSVSRWEGMPNAVMESMAAGCPVVVSEIPSHRAILDDDAAWFAPVEDVAGIAAAIHTALRDDVGRRTRTAAARRRAEAWSVREVSARWVALYEEIAAARA